MSHSTTNRLLLAVALTALLTLSTICPAQMTTFWPDPVANDAIPPLTAGIRGPILGRPTATSMRVWIRSEEPTEFEVVYDTRVPFSEESPRVKGQTVAEADNTGVVDLSGLKANTRYYYGVIVGGRLVDTRIDTDAPWPSFRTFPDAETYRDAKFNPKGLYNVCFSVGACAQQDPRLNKGAHYSDAPAFRRLMEQHGEDIQFHYMNGDYIYEELRDGKLSGYRNNYKLYMDRGRSMTNLQRHVPWMFMFDDHELTGEQGMGQVGLGKGPWCDRDDGIRAWLEYAGWADYAAPQRGSLVFGHTAAKAGSDVIEDPKADFSTLDPAQISTIQIPNGQPNAGVYGLVEVLDAHRLKIRPALKKDDPECRYTIGTHHYFDWKMSNCHFFALDTRSERSKFSLKKQFDPKQTVLGPAQKKWLLEGIAKTDAEFIFIISSVPWMLPHTAAHVGGTTDPKGDTFVGFAHERNALLDAFDRIDKPVIIFTGDVHNSFSVQISDNVWEFLCCPMNSAGHPIATTGDCPYGGWYDSAGRKVKVKWTAGFPTMHYTRLHSTLYTVVQVNNILKSGRPKEPGYRFVAYDEPTVVVRFHDGYTGKLLYAEAVSTMGEKIGLADRGEDNGRTKVDEVILHADEVHADESGTPCNGETSESGSPDSPMHSVPPADR